MSQWRSGQKAAIIEQARARGMLVQPASSLPIPAKAIKQEPEKMPVKPARAILPNKTEREYEMMLKREHPGAEIRFEAITLRLASRATYTPDFVIFFPDGRIEAHETKGGYIFPKALAKVRIAAETFPFRFVLAQKLKSGWQFTELSGAYQRAKQS